MTSAQYRCDRILVMTISSKCGSHRRLRECDGDPVDGRSAGWRRIRMRRHRTRKPLSYGDRGYSWSPQPGGGRSIKGQLPSVTKGPLAASRFGTHARPHPPPGECS